MDQLFGVQIMSTIPFGYYKKKKMLLVHILQIFAVIGTFNMNHMRLSVVYSKLSSWNTDVMTLLMLVFDLLSGWLLYKT